MNDANVAQSAPQAGAPQTDSAQPPQPPVGSVAPPSAPEPSEGGLSADQLRQVLHAAGFNDDQIAAMARGDEPQMPTGTQTNPSTPSTSFPQANESADDEPANEDGAGGSPEAPAAASSAEQPQVEPPAPEPPVQRGVGSMRSAAPSAAAPLTPGQEYRAWVEQRSYL